MDKFLVFVWGLAIGWCAAVLWYFMLNPIIRNALKATEKERTDASNGKGE